MKFRILNLFFIMFLVFSIACSDDNKPLTPPDYSDMIIGNWNGIATTQVPDTLLFQMSLDAVQNNVTGTSKFIVNNEPLKDLTVTGVITYPKINLTLTSTEITIQFSGEFSVTNNKILAGTIDNEKYHEIPTTFIKQ